MGVWLTVGCTWLSQKRRPNLRVIFLQRTCLWMLASLYTKMLSLLQLLLSLLHATPLSYVRFFMGFEILETCFWMFASIYFEFFFPFSCFWSPDVNKTAQSYPSYLVNCQNSYLTWSYYFGWTRNCSSKRVRKTSVYK